MEFRDKGVKSDMLIPTMQESDNDMIDQKIRDDSVMGEPYDKNRDTNTSIGENQQVQLDGKMNYCRLSVEDVKSMIFQNCDAAEAFYRAYAKYNGFRIRKHDLRKLSKENIMMCKWVCCKEGKRDTKWYDLKEQKHRPRVETRENCKVLFRVKFHQVTVECVVIAFVKKHMHILVPPSQVHFLAADRPIKEADKVQAKSIHMVRVRTNKIIDLVSYQLGGYYNMGFTEKNMYNYIDLEQR
ncbi:protein FAR1-RELATED SEQUENCE 5-like [Ricinus communis]|uniref:protein FAR1-RELATED SEQUENCE 5-like n=1 Tax=Ricinus communis TaxID=3988 RepID=UPI00201A5E9E|nr:protein FAR1-RELATED SEQUENCE 5-like [Ricinus communis]